MAEETVTRYTDIPGWIEFSTFGQQVIKYLKPTLLQKRLQFNCCYTHFCGGVWNESGWVSALLFDDFIIEKNIKECVLTFTSRNIILPCIECK